MLEAVAEALSVAIGVIQDRLASPPSFGYRDSKARRRGRRGGSGGGRFMLRRGCITISTLVIMAFFSAPFRVVALQHTIYHCLLETTVHWFLLTCVQYRRHHS